MGDSAVVAPSQNGWLDSLNQFTSAITTAGTGAANIYSTFMSAKTTAALAQSQKAGLNYQPTAAELNAINQSRAQTLNMVTYLGIGVAVLGTLALIYKAVK